MRESNFFCFTRSREAAKGLNCLSENGSILQINAFAVPPFAEQVFGQLDAWMPSATHRFDLRHRIGQQGRIVEIFIGQLVDETRIRTIFQKPPHEIGEQIAMPAHRGVDPAMITLIAHQPLIKSFAHAVEALEFEIAVPPRPFENRCHR